MVLSSAFTTSSVKEKGLLIGCLLASDTILKIKIRMVVGHILTYIIVGRCYKLVNVFYKRVTHPNQ